MKKKCYIYMRVSTVVQVDGYSLDAQQKRLREYADYKEYEIAGEYCDAGRSGGNIVGRPEFQKMMADITSGKDNISYVLVFKLSRFGRNAADVLKSLQLLEDYDVNLVSVEEGIDSSSASGRLTLSLLSAVAEIEKDNIRDQFVAGRMQKFREGGWYGGPRPFGYQLDGKGLAPDPKEAELVARIFHAYLEEDATISSTAEKMNIEGWKRHYEGRELPIDASFVKRVLDNETYCGRLAYKKRKKQKRPDGREVYIRDGSAIVVAGKQPALVSEELWEAAHAKRLATTQKFDSLTPERMNLLSGLVKCPVCGRGMTMTKSKKVNKNHGGYYKQIFYYRCRYYTKANGRACTYKHQINQDKVDSAVHEIICRLPMMRQFQSAVEKYFGKSGDAANLKEELHQLQKQLNDVLVNQKKYGDSLDALDFLSEDYDARYEEIQKKLDATYDAFDDIEGQIRRIKKRMQGACEMQADREKLMEMLTGFGQVYQKMTDAEKKELYRSMIERIDLFEQEKDDRIIKSITFRFPVRIPESDSTADINDQFRFTLDCSKLAKTAAESKATYAEIRSFIWEKYGKHVSSLNIAQVKRKYGLELGIAYNKPEVPKRRQAGCTPEKEELIVRTLQHFKMLPVDHVVSKERMDSNEQG